MLPDIPFASAEDLQPGRVDHDVARNFGRGQPEREPRLAATHRSVVRHRELHTHQFHHGLEEPLGGPEAQVEDSLDDFYVRCIMGMRLRSVSG